MTLETPHCDAAKHPMTLGYTRVMTDVTGCAWVHLDCTGCAWVHQDAPGTTGYVAERDRRAENHQERDIEGSGEEAVLLMYQAGCVVLP